MDIGVTIAVRQYLKKEIKEAVMKKFIVLLCVFLTLNLLSSCGTIQEIDEPPVISDDEGLHEHDEATNNANVEVEPKPLYAGSVDELIGTISNIKQSKMNDTNNVSTMSTLVVPDFTIDGYYLFQIEVTKASVFYYYTPMTVSRSDGLIDYDRDYVVTVRRIEYVNKDDPLQPLIDQLNIQPDEDGYLYDSEHREITFAYENVWVSIRVPKGVEDYQKIKSLCTVNSVKID